jgi:NAD(P)-dependent dehydrogenase (short-subunit alcohol dehydrogenase family)
MDETALRPPATPGPATAPANARARFTGRWVIVTGAGYGIGRAIATAFAAEGAHVALAARSTAKLEESAALLRAHGGEALVVPADVRREEDVARLVRDVHAHAGRIDVLVSNSGITGPTGHVHDTALADWNDTLATNLTGAFLCARAVAPHMIAARGGAIVHIGSVAGRMAYPLRAPYAASKWGLIGFSHSLAAELGPHGIRVNVVQPGSTAGERMERVIATRAAAQGTTPDQARQFFTRDVPLGRMVGPEEVARAVLFLASDEASGITGQVLNVCGGFQMR